MKPVLLLNFNLLDRQIVDRDGIPVGKVDDIELRHAADGTYVAALLTGQQALGRRFPGALGRWITALAARLDEHDEGPRRIPYDLVDHVDAAVHLSVRRDLLAPPALEAWLDRHLIERIRGAGHAG
ncbi:hypothetical protein ACGFI9_02640 [Micromonospora sp. NPDC048930]|uniref:hypothetical protein n=1 Tax=Micromonospora sp. NPDC048930 TaxID=3364261 RepID=UPI00371BCE66